MMKLGKRSHRHNLMPITKQPKHINGSYRVITTSKCVTCLETINK